MTLFLRTGLLLLLAIQPLVLLAADTPAGPLIARGDRNFPPYEFINEKGDLDGFNIDLLKAISRQMRMAVDIDLDTWETVREELGNGKIHMATGMIRSPEREKTFDFSMAHAVTDRIVPVSSPQEALRLLASGRHDCAVIERLSAVDLLKSMEIDTIAMAGPPLVCVPYAFAVRKGDDRLLARLNEGIHRMHQNGVYEDLYRKWFSVANAHARRLAMLRFGALVLAVIVGLAVSVFIWNIALKRLVRRRTAALQQSDRRFRELSDLLPQTVFETDGKGQISFLNRSGFEMLGLKEKTVNDGIYLSSFIPGLPDLDEWAQTGDRRGKACVVSGPDAFPALLYATPVMPGHSHSGLRGLLVDITFQKELEKQVIESQKLEAMGRLAGGMAHDFNNIVHGLSTYAQMIQSQPEDEKAVADDAGQIIAGCNRATDLVHHFLATAGQREPEKRRVQLAQMVSDVFKLLQPTYGNNISFHNTIDNAETTVWAETALVFQVLMNLCVNSVQAMSEKGGMLTVGVIDEETVIASEKEDQSKALHERVLFVKDTGPGIAPECRNRIFDPFFTTKGPHEGTGIGLFVVSQAVSDLGGTIRLESEPGKGATFIVSLPTTPEAETGPESSPPAR
ncbi:MAG: transporter substrate-binding domain-containing protein [Desulfosarcina sp.]|nr:transporter substrate-binding domain-containing protein [Desulfosarcina sp.]MBC2765736.1 transporter substrate-binding domain-containing protein [Desulfosarcina sp.]